MHGMTSHMPARRNLALLLAGVAVAALLLRLGLYIQGCRHLPITTDEAITVLQAKQVLRGEWPVLMMAQPYMFPLEAYWMAPLAPVTPRNTWGMRVLTVIEGAVFLWLTLAILRRMGAWRTVWPGVLWALFPSAYLIINQFAYSQPHNNSAFILALAALYAALAIRAPDEQPAWRGDLAALAAGCFGALAFSNAMLAVSLALPALIVAAMRAAARNWIRWPALALGSALGLLPRFAAGWLHPGANQGVAGTRPLAEALGLLWTQALTRTLPVAMGINPCLFPDSEERLGRGIGLLKLFPWLFAALLLLALGLALAGWWRQTRRRQWPAFGGLEWSLGAIILTTLLFALSTRSDSGAYRYLASVAVAFPMLLAGIAAAGPRARIGAGMLAAGFALFNLCTTALLARAWATPGFGDTIVRAPDLEPAIAHLRARGIRHAVASHWAAYRLTFYTDETILCAQPLNERFANWPLPYKTEVDAATNVAYVLTDAIRFLKPDIFERHLRTMRVTAQVHTAGHFKVYTDFRPLDPPARALTGLVFTASQNEPRPGVGDAGLAHLGDGSDETFWRSTTAQATGQWVRAEWPAPATLDRLILDYGRFGHDMPPALTIEVLTDTGWRTTHPRLAREQDKFRLPNGHPVYGGARQTIRFEPPGLPPVMARGVRLTIAQPDPRFAWTLTGIEVLATQSGVSKTGLPSQLHPVSLNSHYDLAPKER